MLLAKEALPALGLRGVVTAAGRRVAKGDLLFFVFGDGVLLVVSKEIAGVPSAKVYFQYTLPFVLGDPWCLDIQDKGGRAREFPSRGWFANPPPPSDLYENSRVCRASNEH